MGRVLGLDIGIASVGWSLIDTDTEKIVNMGARLFESADANNNVARREARSARRNIRRKAHRLETIDELLEEKGFTWADNIDMNPYELRVKGLKEKLEAEEIYASLYHLAKRRGISYLDEIEDEGKVTNDSLKVNRELLKEKYPCEIQLERLNEYGKVRGIIEVEKEDGSIETLINIFTTSAYKREAEQILNTQKEFYNQIDSEFIQDYLKILTRKRDFYVGPGNEKSRTNYGIYKTDGRTIDSIFEELIGKCSIYTDEQRAPSSSYSAQEFNLLNDLNNLTIKGEKLTEIEKREIIKEILTSSGMGKATMVKIFKSITDIEGENDIKGTSIDKDGKMVFEHTFEMERKLIKYFKDTDIDYGSFSIEEKDNLAIVLSKSMDYKTLVANCQNMFPVFSDEDISLLFTFLQKNKSNYSRWHSFSLKLMREMREDLYKKPKNQMNYLTEKGIKKSVRESFSKYKYIPEGFLDEEIYNPVVRRSVNQSIKLINALIKRYGELEAIIIEMPRETNEKDEKKKIDKMQADNKKEKDNALKRANDEYSIKPDDLYKQRDLLSKVRLWYQQDGRCIYTGNAISIQELTNYPNKFEIDHIIPKSISFDDGLNNKVLCVHSANQIKGQRTPFRAFSINTNNIDYDDIKKRAATLLKSKKISRTKHDLLTFEEDVNKYEVRQKFISRNLNDTRYASKAILNGLQEYMNEKEKDTEIHVVRGKFTYQIRKNWKLVKDRDESFDHHAVDATIVAASYMLGQSEDTIRNPFLQRIDKYKKHSKKMWKIIDNKEYDKEVYKLPWDSFIKDLNIRRKNIKYSHKIDTKVNRAISDATLYSTRTVDGEDYKVDKYKNIYDNVTAKKLIKKINDDLTNFENIEDSKILMRKHDPQTFGILVKIIEDYKGEKPNPFEAYRKEHGYIRKYSKKGNGPIIKDIKYLDSKLGEGIRIEKTKDLSPNKKVALLALKHYRTDVYFNKENKMYKNISINYSDIEYVKGKHMVKQDVYNYRKEKLGINNNYKFLFSLHKHDIIGIRTKKEPDIDNRFKFITSRTDKPNKITIKPINRSEFSKSSPMIIGTKVYKGKEITISKDIEKFNKYHTDILGNIFNVQGEKLKFEFKLDNINNV